MDIVVYKATAVWEIFPSLSIFIENGNLCSIMIGWLCFNIDIDLTKHQV